MEQERKKTGGRKKGVPNRPKPVKVMARIVEEYTEYFNTRNVLPSSARTTPGMAITAAADERRFNDYCLACIALELMKQKTLENG